MASVKHCPSCASDQIEVAGDRVFCRECEIIYEVKEGKAAVVDHDPLGRVNRRLDDLEARLPAGRPAGNPPDPGKEPDLDEEEEDEDEEGFLIWE